MLRTDPQRQRRRPRRSDTAYLARLGGHPRHQGRELDPDGRMAAAFLALRYCSIRPIRHRPRTTRCSRSGEGRRKSATFRTSRTSWSIPKARSSGAIIGRRPVTRCWSARSCMCSMPRRTRRSRGVANLPVRSRARPIETHAAGDDDDAASERTWPSSGRRVSGARAPEQERERALRRPVDRDELPRPLSRSDRCDGHVTLRLAHRRPRRRQSIRSRSTSSCHRRTSAAPSRSSA